MRVDMSISTDDSARRTKIAPLLVSAHRLWPPHPKTHQGPQALPVPPESDGNTFAADSERGIGGKKRNHPHDFVGREHAAGRVRHGPLRPHGLHGHSPALGVLLRVPFRHFRTSNPARY